MAHLESTLAAGDGHLGTYWRQVLTDTIVWHEPTAEEAAAARAQRREQMTQSNVPAIVTDLGALMTFFDDVQDVVSFTRWNKKIFSAARLRDCIRRQHGGRYTTIAEIMRCACPAGHTGKGRVEQEMMAGAGLLTAAGIGAAAFLLPILAPVAYILLAGQVSMLLFGVGISLGPIVGALLETVFTATSAVGFTGGADNNKAHQLARARVIKNARAGLGAMQYLSLGDQIAAVEGVRFALRDIQPTDPIVVPPSEYPHLLDLITDPFGTVRSLGRLGTSLAVNGLGHIVPGLADSMWGDLNRLAGIPGQTGLSEPDAAVKAALKVIHDRRCPRKNTCREVTDEMVRFQEFFASHGLSDFYHRPEAESIWQMLFGEAAVPVG